MTIPAIATAGIVLLSVGIVAAIAFRMENAARQRDANEATDQVCTEGTNDTNDSILVAIPAGHESYLTIKDALHKCTCPNNIRVLVGRIFLSDDADATKSNSLTKTVWNIFKHPMSEIVSSTTPEHDSIKFPLKAYSADVSSSGNRKTSCRTIATRPIASASREKVLRESLESLDKFILLVEPGVRLAAGYDRFLIQWWNRLADNRVALTTFPSSDAMLQYPAAKIVHSQESESHHKPVAWRVGGRRAAASSFEDPHALPVTLLHCGILFAPRDIFVKIVNSAEAFDSIELSRAAHSVGVRLYAFPRAIATTSSTEASQRCIAAGMPTIQCEKAKALPFEKFVGATWPDGMTQLVVTERAIVGMTEHPTDIEVQNKGSSRFI